jgi:hypothetical protein
LWTSIGYRGIGSVSAKYYTELLFGWNSAASENVLQVSVIEIRQ